MHRIIKLLQADAFRMDVLRAVASLELPDCYVAAGFIRNLIWDDIHNYPPTPLNDVDVVYYSYDLHCDVWVMDKLSAMHPDINWQIKNQAHMHLKNGDPAYKSTTDAMTYWPEHETAIGVQLDENNNINLTAPFGIESLLNGFITHNTKRDKAIFLNRIEEKQWLTKWPKLKNAP